MDIAALTANGFVPTIYEGQEGTFYAKRIAARDMQYFH
ncbi:hypothetical protein C7402_103263 [Paraburkholderia unamae]|uniref:Uncharacterized protein n=1 Tax=Paraburkholderia unamae TaxID=219649 RepID=A0ABX5KSE0_9BURK|nr:hypothetical protein C7402_103263 [Paraburkholderia unamae]RAR47982.1 hypothetical protein C7401_15423 [Paraburkholderia unamae]